MPFHNSNCDLKTCDKRIFKLVTSYQKTNILLYLKGLAKNVSLK
jgi:hypothetical protein